jgi:hypothetical protein
VFHVELRQFPGIGRKFNLSRQQLEARFVRPWLNGQVVELDDRKYVPDRATLRILEGPELRPDQIGMGRGWANAERDGTDVTDRVLSGEKGAIPAPSPAGDGELEEFKAGVLSACAGRRLTLGDVVVLATVRHPRARTSERLALAERAVWELLHQQRIAIFTANGNEPLARERWEETVLAWGSWTAPAGAGPEIVTTPSDR